MYEKAYFGSGGLKEHKSGSREKGGRQGSGHQGMCLTVVFRALPLGHGASWPFQLSPMSYFSHRPPHFSNSPTGYTGLHFLVQAAPVKLTFHTLASGKALMVKSTHGWPCPLAKRPNEETLTRLLHFIWDLWPSTDHRVPPRSLHENRCPPQPTKQKQGSWQAEGRRKVGTPVWEAGVTLAGWLSAQIYVDVGRRSGAIAFWEGRLLDNTFSTWGFCIKASRQAGCPVPHILKLSNKKYI